MFRIIMVSFRTQMFGHVRRSDGQKANDENMLFVLTKLLRVQFILKVH